MEISSSVQGRGHAHLGLLRTRFEGAEERRISIMRFLWHVTLLIRLEEADDAPSFINSNLPEPWTCAKARHGLHISKDGVPADSVKTRIAVTYRATYRNPAPADNLTERIGMVNPEGTPFNLGSWEKEYWVLAMQTIRCLSNIQQGFDRKQTHLEGYHNLDECMLQLAVGPSHSTRFHLRHKSPSRWWKSSPQSVG